MSKKEQYEAQTQSLLEPILAQLQLELVDVEYVNELGTYYLRAYIDKPGGVTIDDCEQVSRAFSDVLDFEDYIADSYIFEVSSPDLSRPLKKEKDFLRNMGQILELRTYKAVDKEKEFIGKLTNYQNGAVTLQGEDGEERTFQKEDIARVRLALDI